MRLWMMINSVAILALSLHVNADSSTVANPGKAANVLEIDASITDCEALLGNEAVARGDSNRNAENLYFDLVKRAQKIGKDRFLVPELQDTVAYTTREVQKAFTNIRRAKQERHATVALEILRRLNEVKKLGYPYRQTIESLLLATRIFTVENLLLKDDPKWIYEIEVLMGELDTGELDADLKSVLDMSGKVFVIPTYKSLNMMTFVSGSHVPLFWVGVVREPIHADGFWMDPTRFFIHDLQHAKILIKYLYRKGVPGEETIRRRTKILDNVIHKINDITDKVLRRSVTYLLFFSLHENIFQICDTDELYNKETFAPALESVRLGRFPEFNRRMGGDLENIERHLRAADAWIFDNLKK